jgi:CheY-like chemotaxis protein
LAQCFEPFFTTKGPHEGTGLGLSSAFGIVTQSGGFLRADSTPGTGSTFEIFLPLSGTPVPEVVVTARTTRSHGGARRVLVVEDDAGVRRMTVRMLARAGYEVLEAADGAEALRLAEGEHLDLVVTDVLMPGMSGRALVDQLAAQQPGLRALFVSGYGGDPRLQTQGPRAGEPFLAKPFTSAALTHSVAQLLGEGEAKRSTS